MLRESQAKPSAAPSTSEGDELQATLDGESAFPEAFGHAVIYLVERGIPKEEAASNLAAILQSIGSREGSSNDSA